MSSFALRLRTGQPFFAFPRRIHAMGARFTAGLAATLALAALGLHSRWIVAALAVDFTVRALAGPRLSPLGRMAGAIVTSARVRPTTTSGAPKQLAALAGACMLAAAAALIGAGLATAGWALVGILVVLATLEAALGLCVVCRIYALFIDCPDCAGEG